MKHIKPYQPKEKMQNMDIFTPKTYKFLDDIVTHKKRWRSVNNWDTTVLTPKIVGTGDKIPKGIKKRNAIRHAHYRHDIHSLCNIVSSDNKVWFQTWKIVPHKFDYQGIEYTDYDPQGLIISPHATHGYISINASSSDSDNIKFTNREDGNGVIQFIRCNLTGLGVLVPENAITAGPPFNGGHGQAIAMNPQTNKIWDFNNASGTNPNGGMMEISKHDLKPIKDEIIFHSTRSSKYNSFNEAGYRLGNDLTFDGNGNVINICPNTKGDSPLIPQFGLKIYKGSLTQDSGLRLSAVPQYIRNAGGVTIQVATYSSYFNRIYIGYTNCIISFPADKLGKLKPHDIHQTIFNSFRETEGLSFDKKGNAYLLVDRYPEIMKCPSRMAKRL